VTTDPVTGIRDGILKRPKTDPLVFEIDEELMFWQWFASLNVVDGQGNPVPVPPNVRLYHLNGFGHIGASGLNAPAQPVGMCRYAQQYQSTTLPAISRALTIAIDDWADRGIEPPASRYPRIEDGTLVSLDEYRKLFPRIADMLPPQAVNTAEILDFGPKFKSTGGVQSRLPPGRGKRYEMFVPRPSADGPGTVGINTLWTRAPLGTNVGWNVRAAKSREAELCYLTGAYVPFAKTKAERLAQGDSRPSLEERYHDHTGFVRAAEEAIRESVKDRFLLPEDAAVFVKAAQDSDVLK
jgi:hypothetical protein